MLLANDNEVIEFGARGDPTQPIKDTLARRGLQITGRTIRFLRSGQVRPDGTLYRLASAERLRSNDASLKNIYCLGLLDAALAHRQPTRTSRGLYLCVGLGRAVQTELGLAPYELSWLLRTMRADLALWSTITWDEPLMAEFRAAASLFLRVHHPQSWKAMRGINDLTRVAWDGQTIHGFYFALCTIAASVTRAAWFPYEVDALHSFYALQRRLGDPLTPLDRQVLAGGVNRNPTASDLCQAVRAHCGVEYSRDCVKVHRRLLVLGAPATAGQRYPSPPLPSPNALAS